VIYLRVEYADGLRARVNARAFARLHGDVTLETSLADFALRWFGDSKGADDDGARAAALGACDAALRGRQDEERKRRAESLRRRSRERRGEASL
jgi:hypothetical protein